MPQPKAWTVWAPSYVSISDYCGVVVYAETRGQARWLGAAGVARLSHWALNRWMK